MSIAAFALPAKVKSDVTIRDLIKRDALRQDWTFKLYDGRTDIYHRDGFTLILWWSITHSQRAMCGYSFFGPTNVLIERNYRMSATADARRRLAGLSF